MNAQDLSDHTVTIHDTAGSTIHRPQDVLAGRRYAAIEADPDGTFVAVGRVLAGAFTIGEWPEESCVLVSCSNCGGEIEVDTRDDPAVAEYVRMHRCDEDWDTR